MKCRILLLKPLDVLFLLFILSSGLFAMTISGEVKDEQNNPIPNAHIHIHALEKDAMTNQDGKFRVEDIPSGTHAIELKAPHFPTQLERVVVTDKDVLLSITLSHGLIELPALIVTAKPFPTESLNTPQSVTVIQGKEMNQHRGENAIKTIENTPGVTTFTTGAGISKPVIRGLTSNRVLVISDGIRQEGNQFGDEHGTEVDSFSVSKVEVLRGPSSLLYGSDALGGVVHLMSPELPSENHGDPKFGGNLSFNKFSNNRQGAGAISLFGVHGPVGYRGSFSQREAGNMNTPERRMFNSGMNEMNGSGTFGIESDWGTTQVDYSKFDQRLEIHEDPTEDPTATKYQKIQHDKVQVRVNLPMELIRLELAGAYQRNNRREFGNKDAISPDLNLLLKTGAVDLKAHHQPWGPFTGTVGISFMRQLNETLAMEPLIPGFDSYNYGGFIYEEVVLDKFTFSLGGRMDGRTLNVNANEELQASNLTKRYDALSGAFGMVYRALEPLAFAFNVGRGWRAPSVSELFSFGVHEGTGRFEIGENSLKPEKSFNLDTSVRYASKRWRAEVTFFRNKIEDFIFPGAITSGVNPVNNLVIGEIDPGTGEPVTATDPTSGNPLFKFQHAGTTFIGGELGVEGEITKWILLSAGTDWIRGENDTLNRPLPLVPANRIRVGAKLQKHKFGILENSYFSIETKLIDTQTRLGAGETRTAGYTLVDLGLGTEISIAEKSHVNIDLKVDNLFDRAYVDHLSRYKAYALNPGRNIIVKVTVPF